MIKIYSAVSNRVQNKLSKLANILSCVGPDVPYSYHRFQKTANEQESLKTVTNNRNRLIVLLPGELSGRRPDEFPEITRSIICVAPYHHAKSHLPTTIAVSQL